MARPALFFLPNAEERRKAGLYIQVGSEADLDHSSSTLFKVDNIKLVESLAEVHQTLSACFIYNKYYCEQVCNNSS